MQYLIGWIRIASRGGYAVYDRLNMQFLRVGCAQYAVCSTVDWNSIVPDRGCVSELGIF